MFQDRRDAGRQLAARLAPPDGPTAPSGPAPVVLGLPRGGIPVAVEVAGALGAPLDVIVVRKVGVPGNPELALGAVGEGDAAVINEDVLGASRVRPDELAAIVGRERAEVAARLRRFRRDRAPVALAGRTAIVVDDGVATGATARAACQVARLQGASRVVLAAPVIAKDTVRALRTDADTVVAVATPAVLMAISGWYDDFTQVTDDEVVAMLHSG